jgi:hypothetical protein
MEQFRPAALEAAATGHRTAESWRLHDLVRTRGKDGADRLRQLAGECDSPWLRPGPAMRRSNSVARPVAEEVMTPGADATTAN